MSIDHAPHMSPPPEMLPPGDVLVAPYEQPSAVGMVALAGALGHETAQVNNINGIMGEMLDPERLAADRARLLAEESDPDFPDRYVSGGHAGFMEARPKSLIMRSSDPRSSAITRGIQDSPQLTHRAFVPQQELLALANYDEVIAIEAIAKDPSIELPLANFVSAQGFGSWEQGRGDVAKRGAGTTVRRSSAETIAQYQKQNAEGAPPLEAVTGFVQPNGVVVFVTERGSHRTAAAIARGDPTIKVKNLTMVPLREDYFAFGHTA